MLFAMVTISNAQLVLTGIDKDDNYVTSKTVTFQTTPATNVIVIEEGRIETENTLTLNQSRLVFKDITIKAREIIFTNTVTDISIKGAVRLECEKIEFAGAAGASISIAYPDGKGEFIINYSKQFIEPGKSFTTIPQISKDVVMKIEKIP